MTPPFPEKLLQIYVRNTMPEDLCCGRCQRPFAWGDTVALWPSRIPGGIALTYICEHCLDTQIEADKWTPPA